MELSTEEKNHMNVGGDLLVLKNDKRPLTQDTLITTNVGYSTMTGGDKQLMTFNDGMFLL